MMIFNIIMTKITKLIIAIGLLLMVPIAASGASVRVDVDNLRYTVDTTTKEALLYGPVSSSTKIINLVIPKFIAYNGAQYTVTKIRNEAFLMCDDLTSVVIPNTITTIGPSAFDCCFSLSSLIIEDGEETLYLWYNYFNKNDVGEGLFYHCPLTSIYLGRNLDYPTYKAGGYSPFYKTSVVSLTIGNSVTSIGDNAFMWCSELTSVTIPNSVTSIGKDAFTYCTGLTSVTIGNSVTSIGDYAFSDCSGLTSLSIGNSVTSIGNNAFMWCSELTSVTIPNSVTSIGNDAFLHCTGLTSLSIGNSVTSIGDYAFCACSGLTSLSIGNSVTYIGDHAFFECSSLSTLILEDGSKTLTIGSNYLWSEELFDCPLTTLYLGRNISYPTDNSPFYNKKTLTSLTIGKTVTRIPESAFASCKGLTSLKIPNSVTSIGNDAFSACSGLTSVSIGNSVTSIGDYAFSDCSGLTSLSIGNSVTSIGNNAFMWCSELSSLTIPNSVKSIGKGVFYECIGLKEVKLSISLSKIPYVAFSGCKSLEKINIPDPVRTIEADAFRECSSLTQVTLPGSLRKMSLNAFWLAYPKSVKCLNPIPPEIVNFDSDYISYLSELQVPEGSKELYMCHPGWTKMGKNIKTWAPNAEKEFVLKNITYFITSEEDATVEVTASNLSHTRGSQYNLVIPAEVSFNGKVYRVVGIANNGLKGSPITSITLPETIGYVGVEAFKGCSELKYISCLAQLPPSVNRNSFDDVTYETAMLGVAEDCTEAYKNDAVWGLFKMETANIMVSSLSIDPTVWNGITGEKFSITATVKPENATNKKLNWSSSNNAIASVDDKGSISVLKEGTSTITVSTSDGSNLTAECIVTSTSGLEGVFANHESVDVYSSQGYLMLKDCTKDQLNHLAPGIYILRNIRGTSITFIKH